MLELLLFLLETEKKKIEGCFVVVTQQQQYREKKTVLTNLKHV